MIERMILSIGISTVFLCIHLCPVSYAKGLHVFVSGKNLTVIKDLDTIEVIDSTGSLVHNETLATKAAFAYQVREDLMQDVWDNVAKYKYIPPMHKTLREWGSFMQYSKDFWAWILLRPLQLLSSESHRDIYKNIAIDALLAGAMKVLDHPEKACKGLSTEAYQRGSQAWDNIIKTARTTYTSKKILTYEDTEIFIEDYYNRHLCGIANQLTNDIVLRKYGNVNTDFANTMLKQLKGRAAKLSKSSFLIEVYRIIDDIEKGLGQYPPYKTFSKNLENLVHSYARKRLDYMTEAAKVGLRQGRSTRETNGEAKQPIESNIVVLHDGKSTGELFDFSQGKILKMDLKSNESKLVFAFHEQEGDLYVRPSYNKLIATRIMGLAQCGKVRDGSVAAKELATWDVKYDDQLSHAGIAGKYYIAETAELEERNIYWINPKDGKGIGMMEIIEVQADFVRFKWQFFPGAGQRGAEQSGIGFLKWLRK